MDITVIEKKSVVKLPPDEGAISDTTNIENKELNTYSARLIEELIKSGSGQIETITDSDIDEIIV